MKYYGYILSSYHGVCNKFSDISFLSKLFPYAKFRVFYSYEEAQNFVDKHKLKHPINSLCSYGDNLCKHYVDVDYIIFDNSIYYNIRKHNLDNIEFSNSNFTEIKYADLTMLKIENITVNNNSIISHAIAIYNLLSYIGDCIDICLEIPNKSIYYMLYVYTGTNEIINKVQNMLRSRLGGFAVTVKRW